MKPHFVAALLIAVVTTMPACQSSSESLGAPLPNGNIVKNSNFKEWSSGVPQHWMFEDKVRSKGGISRSSGTDEDKPGVAISPNKSNTEPVVPLAIGQAWPANLLKGKTLSVSARLFSTEGATAEFGVFAVEKSGQISASLVLSSEKSSDRPTEKSGIIKIPDNRDVLFVIARCAAQGTKGTAYFESVSIEATNPQLKEKTSQSKEAGKSLQARIEIDVDSEIRPIPRTIFGTNVDWVHDGKGLWDVRRGQLDPNLVRLTKELGVSLIRFPGGALSDFYHWRDGIGPQAARKSTHHTGPKSDISKHTFGTDEALELAKKANAELLITVNAGTGTPEEAADWIRYTLEQHRRRGMPRVNFWEVGNELYIKDDNPTTTVANPTIPPEQYAQRFLKFAESMKEADPTIKIGAIGGQNFAKYQQNSFPDWNEKVLKGAGKEIDFFAIHNAYAPLVIDHRFVTVRQVYAAMLAAPKDIKSNIETVSHQIDQWVPERSKEMTIAVTEWGPFFHGAPESPYVDHVKTLGSALFVASTLNAFISSPKVEIGNFYKLVEPVFMGWIGKRKGEWIANAPYLALQLYTHHLEEMLVQSTVKSPLYDSDAVGMIDRISDVPYLDAIASKSADGKSIVIMAVNKHFDSPIKTAISIKGIGSSNKGQAHVLSGTGIDANLGATPLNVPGIKWAKQASDANNPRFAHGGPGEVTVDVMNLENVGSEFDFTFPAHSVTAIRIQRD